MTEEKKIEEQKKLLANPMVVKVLQYKKEGMSDGSISKLPDISWKQQTVSTYVKRIIEAGLITKEEIDQAIEKRKQREKENDPNRKRVLEGLRVGETDKMIANDTTVGEAQVRMIRKTLVKEGVITEKEIEKAKEERNKQEQIKNQIKYRLTEKEVLHYLKLGYENFEVRREKPNFDTKEYKKTIKQLLKKNKITEKEIEENKEKRQQSIKERILEALKEGMSLRYMATSIGFSLDRDRVKTFIKRIKEEENITDQDILRWKQQNESSIEKKKEFVLEGLKKGWTNVEISEKYSRNGLSPANVSFYKTILLSESKITEEEINQVKIEKKEKQKRNDFDLSEESRNVLNSLRKGFLKEEIASFLGIEPKNVKNKMDYLKKIGRITNEEILQARKKRAEEKKAQDKIIEKEQLKRAIEQEVRLDKSMNAEKKVKIREYILMCLDLYQKENIPIAELEFLKQAMRKINIIDDELIKFARITIKVGKYEDALKMIETVKSKEQRNDKKTASGEKIKKLKSILEKVCKVQKAIQMMQKGNTNSEVLSSITGLSKDEINILKIRLQRKKIKILGVINRRKILELLVMDKDLDKIRADLEMTDLEAEDIQEQKIEYKRFKAQYKKATEEEKVKWEKEMEQKIRVRIIVLYTKLGVKPEMIAKMMKLKPEEIEKDIQFALEQGGLIKQEELQGINPLACYENSQLMELIK
ncbi:MAG: hypothetical protein HFJ33_03720 [Clostridia bacterium]|nr:hypothetical protein [Clostridia bacterium]